MTQKAQRVLIADDNHAFCELLREFLTGQEGFELCGIASDGLEAVNMVKEHSPDILLLDMTMPRLGGLGVLKKLCDLDRPKVIMLTAVASEDVIRRAAELGANYYMVKPVDLVVLADSIRRLADKLPETPTEYIPAKAHPFGFHCYGG